MNITNIFFYWKIVFEILVLWYIIYMTLLFIKGTHAAQLLKGLITVSYTHLTLPTIYSV